jgi:hypothetical protein
MANTDCLGELRAARLVADIISNIANSDDTGQACRDLVQSDAMRMRMEPVETRWMVRRYFYFVVGRVESNRPGRSNKTGRSIGSYGTQRRKAA